MSNSDSAFDLNTLQIASPCKASWDDMEGDARARFCQLCSKNVYDISSMSRPEAEGLVLATEGKICVRFYRRADGTVLTDDCPVGLRAVRDAYRKTTLRCKAVAAGLASIFSAVFAVSAVQAQGKCETKSDKTTQAQNKQLIGEPLQGGAVPIMGKVAATSVRTTPDMLAEKQARTEYQSAVEKAMRSKLPTDTNNGTYYVTLDRSGTPISVVNLKSTGDKVRDREIADKIKETKFDSMPEALAKHSDRAFLKIDLSTQVP